MPDLEKFVAEWKGHMNDDRGIEDMVAEDAQILSPAYWAPKQGKEYVMQVLGSVNTGFDEFTIKREWAQDDTVIYEFQAKLGDVSMKGVDIITVNEDNKLQQIEVLIRPINALMAMAEHVKGGFREKAAGE